MTQYWGKNYGIHWEKIVWDDLNGFKYFYSTLIILFNIIPFVSTQLNGFNYFYWTLIILFSINPFVSTQLNGFKYFYSTLIILFNIYPFVSTQLNGFKYFYSTLIFSVNIIHFFYTQLNSFKYWKWLDFSIWLTDRTPTGFTNQDQSKPGSNGNEGALHIPLMF